jgi:cytochrome oxidase assembly protein ShyY1
VYRFLLLPKWIAFHLLIVALVITMVNLGFWQLRRLDQRQAFNALVTTNISQPAAPLGTVLTASTDPAGVEWRTVTVTGTYVPGQQVLVVNRSQGGQLGRNVVDVLRLADGTAVVVNRGFAPIAVPAPPAPSGSVTVTGVLRRSELRHAGQPEDASGVVLTEIRRIDIDKLAPQIGSPVLPVYVQATRVDNPVLQPIEPPELTNGPHLSYAIQWFVFSICAVAGWVLAVRRSAATRSGRPPKRRGAPPIADELSRVG